MKKIFTFIWNNFYLKNITIIVGLTLFIIVAIFLFLRIYTNHGQALSVPDLTGLRIEEADSVLQKHNLKYKLIDSVYITGAEPGAIVDQVPKPEYKVKKERTIFVTINAHTPEKIVMVDLIGFSYRQALYELNNRGLEVGRIIPVPDIKKGMVLRQKFEGKTIHKGDTIIKGVKIDLEIGNGQSNERVVVPKLVELTAVEAKEKLNALYLNMAGIFDNSVITREDSVEAIAFRQKPGYEKTVRLPMGSFVDVWFTMDSTKMPGYDSLMYVNETKENSIYVDETP